MAECPASLLPRLSFGKCWWLACPADEVSAGGPGTRAGRGWAEGEGQWLRAEKRQASEAKRGTSAFHVLLAQNLTSPFPFCKNPRSVGLNGRQGPVSHRESQRPFPRPGRQGLDTKADFGFRLLVWLS